MKKFEGVFILSDMDGTLLNSKGEIPCENSRAVRYFMENGGMFAVARQGKKVG